VGSSSNESPSSTLSSILNIEYSNTIFFSYHVVGLATSCYRKNLLLMYMYTMPFAWLDVNRFHTLWTPISLEHTCTKMWQVMGANARLLVLIKSHHLCGSKFRSSTRGLENGPQLSTLRSVPPCVQS
jgi:hypothetical protein